MSTIRIPKDNVGYEELLLRCDCHELTHIASIGYFDDEPFININIALRSSAPWYRRVWRAAKYLLGIHDKWGFDEIVLRDEDVTAIQEFLSEYQEKRAALLSD